MKTVTIAIISAITLLQTGCIGTPRYSKLKPQLEQWETNQEYGRSLDALSEVPPTDPDYLDAAKMRKHIEKKAAEYEQWVRRQTDMQLKQGDWAAALDQYDEALDKYPQSPVIKDGLVKLHQQQRADLEQLERKRLLMHGERLQEVLPVYQDIARTDPRSSDAQSRLKHILGEAARISRALAVIGNRALADSDLDNADETLSLAYSLNKDPVIEESLKTLRQKQAAASKRKREKRQQLAKKAQQQRNKRERAIEGILRRYERAFSKKDFLSARAELAKIEKLDNKHHKLASMKENLQKAVDNRVTRLFESGVSAYSRGLFERAADNWREVLALDPDHQQARENLQRAEKVLLKIQKLKSKQQE